MSFAATIRADAKAAHAEAGEPVVYVPAPAPGSEEPAVSIGTFAMRVSHALVPREGDGKRTVGHKLMVSLPKADVERVSTKGDRVTVPGEWVGSSEATVTRPVAELMRDRSSAGTWVLGLG